MKKILLSLSVLALISSCKKNTTEVHPEDLHQNIVNDISENIYLNTYNELHMRTVSLKQDVANLKLNTTDLNLEKCKISWKQSREVWENSEAWLFGPVATESIDPRIDTWPVDFVRLDSILNGNQTLNNAYIDGLEESLKGFHPIEYLLFGLNGNKKASELTPRQLEYLSALTENLDELTTELYTSWSVSGGAYINEVKNYGKNQEFPSKLSLFTEMANSMIGICDEVANGKIGEVFVNLDSMGEESPFAKNSIVDFTNNIVGVKNVYLGKFNSTDVKGMEDFVRAHNLSLDGRIKNKLDLAINALGKITDPFGQAIFTQPIQVQNAIDAINALKDELETGLLPLIELQLK
jgi:putative iron-regulated protein